MTRSRGYGKVNLLYSTYFIMVKTKWISPLAYAALTKRHKQAVYLDIRLGKIKSRKVKKTVVRIEVEAPVDK